MGFKKEKSPDTYKYGADRVCIKCEQALTFYPADGELRVASAVICEKCFPKVRRLLKRMGKPQYWTKK